jgi:uroporphyrin-3 C-methyltransferase
MAQDKKSNPSKASNELTPPGEKEVADVNKAATKTDDDLSTLESLSKLESEIKQSRDAEKANQTAEVKKEEITQSKVKASAGNSSVENNKGQPSPDKTSSTNKDTAKTQTVKVKRQTSWLSIFAFIFSIAASAFVGFFWWQSQLWLKNQEQVDQLKQQAVINTQQSLNQLQAKLNQLQLVV